jgi:hypothetical protein
MLGLVFSVAWLLVIKGSKRSQENWEAHIDELEDTISGPLYKTVYTEKKKPYYSVSNISEFMAWAVIGTWGILLLHYFITILKKHGVSIVALLKIDAIVPIIIVIGGIISIVLLLIKCKSAGNGYKTEFIDGKIEGFVNRKKRADNL